MSDLGRLEPPAHWHDLSEREQRLFAKLEFLAEGRVARTPMVAATVIRNNWGWNMTILPRRRGLRYPVNFATLLGFSPSPYHPERDTLQALRGRLEVDAVTERFRDEIFRLGEPVFDQLAAYLRIRDERRTQSSQRCLFSRSTSSAAPPHPNGQCPFQPAQTGSVYGALP